MSLTLASGLARSQVLVSNQRDCRSTHLCLRNACCARVLPAQPAPHRRQPCSRQARVDAAVSSAVSVDDTRDTAELAAEPAQTASNASPEVSSGLARLGKACRFCCVAFAVTAVLWNFLAPAAQATSVAASGGGSGGFSFAAAAKGLVSFALHLDKHLGALIAEHGTSTYAILFAIVFAETGLVLTPFLPGDSLLFAAGAFAALGSLHLPSLMGIFITAAILGDAVNYAAGHYLGGWALRSGLVKQEYLKKTEEFYVKHGAKTVVLARFIPIVRTFAPFVAGVGSMDYTQFAWFNVAGAVLWTVLFVGAGFFFGNLPFVQHNFTLVVLAIVLVSVLPIVVEILTARREAAIQREQSHGDI